MQLEEYYRTAYRYPVVKEPEAQELLSRIKSGSGDEKAREELIVRNMRFVVGIARKWFKSGSKIGVDPLDLINAGNSALISAIDKYRMSAGSTFYKYASLYIQGYIQNEMDRCSILSRQEIRRRICWNKANNEHLSLNPIVSLDMELENEENGDEPTTFQNKLPDDREATQWNQLFARIDVDRILFYLTRANGKIHPLARQIIELRYGVGNCGGHKPSSLMQVKEKIGTSLSKEGIRKIELRSLNYLREHLASN